MKRLSLVLPLVVAALLQPLFAQGGDNQNGLIRQQPRPLQWHKPIPANAGFFSIDRVSFDRFDPPANRPFTLAGFPIDATRRVALRLERFEVLSPGAQVVSGSEMGDRPVVPERALFFKGSVEEIPGSYIYLAIVRDYCSGYIELPAEHGTTRRVTIAPLALVEGVPSLMVVYDEAVAFSMQEKTQEGWSCGAEEVEGYHAATEQVFREVAKKKESAPRMFGNNLLVAQIAIDCDAAFYSAHGSNLARATTYALTVIGAVSAIYQRDVNVTVQVPYLRVWTGADPYPGTNTATLLPQLRTYWNANMNGVQRTLAHMFSTSAIGGGIAYVNTLCANINTGFGYAVSGLNNNVTYPAATYVWDTDVTSHELGHNFGSSHTHACSWSPAIDSCYTSEGGCFAGTNPRTGTIMSYCHLTPFGTLLNLHPRVSNLIRNRAEAAACVAPLENSPANDVAVASIVVPAPGGAVAASTQFTPEAIFRNHGTIAQSNLSVTFTIKDSTGNQIYSNTQTIGALAAGGTTNVAFAPTSIATVNRYSSTVTITLLGDSYSANNTLIYPFEVVSSVSGSLTIVSPNGGTIHRTGSQVPIAWSSSGVTTATIEWTPNNGATWYTVATNVAAASGSYTWIAPPIATTQARVRILSRENGAVNDWSDQTFTITSLPLDWQWARSAGSTLEDDMRGVAVDNSGNVYVAGIFNDSIRFGSIKLTSNGGSDGFLVKYNQGGTVQWARGIGGSGNDTALAVAIDNSGNAYVVGSFANTMTIGVVNLTSAGDQDVVIAKYDANGAAQWGQRAGGSGRDQARSVAIDNSGNILVTGAFSATALFGATSLTSAGSTDVFIVRYNGAGGVDWAQRGGGANPDEASDIAVGNGGESYITGRYRVSATFGGTTLNGPAGENIFTVKYSAAGIAQWGTTAGGSGDDEGRAIMVDPNGDPIVTGTISSTVNFGTTVAASAGGQDIFLARYTSGGTLSWLRRAGSTGNDLVTGMASDADGNIYITGFFQGQLDIANLGITSNGAANDAFVAKYGNNGGVQWIRRGGGARGDESNAIAIASTGEAGYVVGRFGYSAPVDMPSIFGDTLTGNGANDVVLARLGFFKVTAPRDGEKVQVGTSKLITWTSLASTSVRIEISYDNGLAWSTLAASAPNTGSYTWTVPNMNVQQVIVRVSDADVPTLYGTAYSGTFIIESALPPIDLIADGGNGEVDLYWTASPSPGITSYAIYRAPLSGPGAGTLVKIASVNAPQLGYVDVSVTNCSSYVYAVKAVVNTFESPFSNRDTARAEAPKQITATVPSLGERIMVGSTQMIQWHTAGCITNVKIDLSTDGGASWNLLVPSTGNSGIFAWTIPGMASTRALLRVSDIDDSTVFDVSDTFSICGASAQITAAGATSICPGDSVVLSAPDGFLTYYWSNNATTQSIVVKQSGSFTVTVVDGAGCGATSQPMTVTVDSSLKPVITMSGDSVFCPGDSVMLDAGAGYASYVWNTGSLSQRIIVSNSGTYRVMVTNAGGCSGMSDEVTVTVRTSPAKPTITRNNAGDSLYLTAPAGTYTWYRDDSIMPGVTTTFLKLEQIGRYQVRVTDSNGCTAISDTFTVDSLPTPPPPPPPASIGAVTGDDSFKLHPNPTSGVVMIETMIVAPAAVRIVVTDMRGREVMRIEDARTNGRYRREIDMRELPSGAYFLEMQAGARKWTKKIVKQ